MFEACSQRQLRSVARVFDVAAGTLRRARGRRSSMQTTGGCYLAGRPRHPAIPVSGILQTGPLSASTCSSQRRSHLPNIVATVVVVAARPAVCCLVGRVFQGRGGSGRQRVESEFALASAPPSSASQPALHIGTGGLGVDDTQLKSGLRLSRTGFLLLRARCPQCTPLQCGSTRPARYGASGSATAV